MTEEELSEIQRYVAMLDRRGHATEFATETAEDRKIMEISTAQEWASSLAEQFNLTVCDLNLNDEDPPDCFGMLDSQVVGIELTELVNSKVLSAIAAARKQGRRITSRGELFDLAQWTKSEFFDQLRSLISSKRNKYEQRGIFIDFLVVHTAEPWLDPYVVKDWLTDFVAETGVSIGAVHLLMTYFPGFAEHWPLFITNDHRSMVERKK